ncbi:hypothetical protein [Micromonospora sp. WMMD712]|uniref:hypothetical protein n=1 Tax=Micromonospora sp. WMMD712 TaxID=3016096 RepID=UPI00249A36C4|nr:hypothetical protein [Micromonospora sp. WMMD712]WFE56872.1 hypothetical protein O7633_08260 [Micromonospora sp. WMMD712]
MADVDAPVGQDAIPPGPDYADAGCRATRHMRPLTTGAGTPNEYALANHVQHPRNAYVAERDIVPAFDNRLLKAFAPHRLTDTIRRLHSAKPNAGPGFVAPDIVAANKIIAAYDANSFSTAPSRTPEATPPPSPPGWPKSTPGAASTASYGSPSTTAPATTKSASRLSLTLITVG